MTIQDFWWFESFNTKLKENSNRTKLNLAKRLILNDLVNEFTFENGTFYAEITDLKNRNTNEVSVKFTPLNTRMAEKIIDAFFYSTDDIIEFLNGNFPSKYFAEEYSYLLDLLFDTTNIIIDCSCNSKTIKCEHTAVILLKIAEIIKYNPLFIFEIKLGITEKNILPFLFDYAPNSISEKLPQFLDNKNYTRLEHENNHNLNLNEIKSYMGKSNLDYNILFKQSSNEDNCKKFTFGSFDEEYFRQLEILEQFMSQV